MRCLRLTSSYTPAIGSILACEVLIILGQNPASFGEHSPHPQQSIFRCQVFHIAFPSIKAGQIHNP
jgi:hypothetical protein